MKLLSSYITAIKWVTVSFLCLFNYSHAKERQSHGYRFENWVIENFYNNQNAQYTDKWDVPPHSAHSLVPKQFHTYPVSVKTVKSGQSIGFGDALRQQAIEQDFLLIVGIWDADGNKKYWQGVIVKLFSATEWSDLWNPIQLSDLQSFDSLVKDRSLEIDVVRRNAKALKKKSPFNLAIMQLNPKIDPYGQRRLQCSLQYKVYQYWKDEKTELWGVPIPDSILNYDQETLSIS